MLRTLTALLLLLAASGCEPDAPRAVGSDVSVIGEDQDRSVREAAQLRPAPFVLPDQESLDEWRAALPPAVADAFSAVAPRYPDEVAIVAHYPRCTEYSVLSHEGGGQLAYHVIDPEPTTMCAWSPVQLELHVVALADLDVDDPAAVTVRRAEGRR